MILMMVICTIIFALTLETRMADVGLETQRLMKYTQNRENNYLMARSAVEMGITLLDMDNGDTDSLEDYWARGEITLQWEGRTVKLRIVDEESKFPLSNMQQTPSDCEYLTEALQRFMVNAGVKDGPAAVDQFLDWVDSDGQRRTRGAEESDYTDRRKFKDAPCHSLYEVTALPAWAELPKFKSPRQEVTMDDFGLASEPVEGEFSDEKSVPAASAEEGEFAHSGKGASRFSGGSFNNDVPEAQTFGNVGSSAWEEWMSVYSNGKININTAPIEILRCLDEKMTETLVNEIDQKRRSSAFADINALRGVTGFDEDMRHRLKNFLCFKSENFEIRATVYSVPGTVTLQAIVNRDGDNIKVKRWEVR